MEIKEIVERQKAYFLSKNTLNYDARMNALRKLKNLILEYEIKLKEALLLDLGKSDVESYMTEIGIVLKEIRYFEKHLKKLMKEKRRKSELADFPSKSKISPFPYGVTLVISPWNYPVNLALTPLVGAIASGNTVILKPSEFSEHTSFVIRDLINNHFPTELIHVILGDKDVNQELLSFKFDYIFFTGSTNVGKIVMEKASQYLTPLTLELGGKSPVIIDKDVDIKIAAKRCVFGKYLNAGQTCVAPDYVFVHETIKDEFIQYLNEFIIEFYGANSLTSDALGKIINKRHFTRLINLFKDENIIIGGEVDEVNCKITPTVLDDVSLDADVMQEEIFGPILPILPYSDLDYVIDYINKNPNPLALYLFSNNKKIQNKVIRECKFGGGCINDTMNHVASDYIPFGGVGESGMGSYHGKASFDTFSHYRSVLIKSTVFDLPIRYAPYTKRKEKVIRKFLK